MKRLLLALCFMLGLAALQAAYAQDKYQDTLNKEVKFITNLQADLAQAKVQKKPLLILFSQVDCSFCHNVRSQFLKHLALDPKATVIVREVMQDTTQSLGVESANAFSKRMGIKFYPTVVIYDSQLKPLADPLIGSDTSGFYGSYLERAVDEAAAALK
jgi:thioredoxin-related protein